MKNLVILFTFWLFLTLGCGGSSSGDDSSNERKAERGRLKFVISATSIHTNTKSIFRSVHSQFYVDGKEWSPEGEPEFAEKFDMCDSSPNANLEVLLCSSGFGEVPKSTYLLRMKNDQPEIIKIEAGNDGTWIDDDGRWLLFKKLFYNIETDEKIEVKGMPFADEPNSSPVTFVRGVSPDKKTIVTMFNNIPNEEKGKKFLTLWIVDAEKGAFEKRKVSFTKNPWLLDHKQPEKDFIPPPETYRHFVWKKDAEGRDRLTVPQLLEKVER